MKIGRLRSDERSRFLVPLVLGIGFAVLYSVFRSQPLLFHGYDVREDIFGKDEKWLRFAAIVPLIFLVVRLVDSFIFDLIAARKGRIKSPLLLRQILAVILYFLLFAWATSSAFDVSVTRYIFTGTVLAAVIGLALQETLGNLFSGISLHMEESYQVGDVLHSGDFLGVVEGVSWRSTKIRAFNNQLVVLPNSMLARERLEIFNRDNLNARILQVTIDSHVPPATVIGILGEAAVHVEGVAHEMLPFARLGAFADSGVVYEIKYFTRDYSKRDRIDADIRKAVWYALHRNNIPIPFPIRAYQRYAPPDLQHNLPPEQVLSRLQQVDLLSPLPPHALEEIVTATRVHFYSKGEAILRRGAAGESMFVVHAGTVAVRVPQPGETGGQEVAQLGPGSVFGEMALLTGEARTADVIALSDVIALELGKESLQSPLQQNPNLARAITSKVMLRRQHLETIRAEGMEEEEQTILTRIKSYFGL